MDGEQLEAPSPAQWQELTTPPPLKAVDADSAGDVATELAAAALYRQSMGVLEPTDTQIERMVQRAAAWDDAVAGPQRLTAINAMAMDFYGKPGRHRLGRALPRPATARLAHPPERQRRIRTPRVDHAG